MPKKGEHLSAEHRAKLIAANLEQRAASSARMMGNQYAKGNKSGGFRGHTVSAEHRAKLSMVHVGNRHVLDAPVKGDCAYCLKPATTYDHMIPRGRAGWLAPNNTVPCCRSCNAAKGQRTPAEWFAVLGLPVSADFEALFHPEERVA